MANQDQHDAHVDLILRFQEGDHGAVHQLVDIYGRRLQGFLRMFVKSEELAEDLSQDVFVLAYTKRKALRNPAKFQSWLFRMARNTAINEMKRARYRMEAPCEEEVIEGVVSDEGLQAMQPILQEQMGTRIDEALQTLDEKKRTIMALRYFGEMPLKEIAEVMDIPMGSIGTMISRSLQQMRRHLESKGIDGKDLIP